MQIILNKNGKLPKSLWIKSIIQTTARTQNKSLETDFIKNRLYNSKEKEEENLNEGAKRCIWWFESSGMMHDDRELLPQNKLIRYVKNMISEILGIIIVIGYWFITHSFE